MLDYVTCGFGLPWQEDEEHVVVDSQAKKDVNANTTNPTNPDVTCGFGEVNAETTKTTKPEENENEVVRPKDQDLDYLSNRLVMERDFLLKRCTTAEQEVKKLTQARYETEDEVKKLTQERDESSGEINKLRKERNDLRNALDGQVEDRDLLDTVFEWI
jgi:septal ring factor EnvC (AmiA/AmiB activator)